MPHILLIEAGFEFRLALTAVGIAKGERFSDEFKALYPKSRIPILKLNEDTITEPPANVTERSCLAPDGKFLDQTTPRVRVAQLPRRSGA